MHIAIITSAFIPLPPASCGAIERTWTGLAEEFARHGHRVTFYSRAHPGVRGRVVDGAITYLRRTAYNRTGSRIIDVCKGVAYATDTLRTVRDAHLCVCNDVVTAWLWPFIGRVPRPVILNVQRMPRSWRRHCYAQFDHLIAPSTAVREALCQLEPSLDAHTTVIGNPIYYELFEEVGRQTRKRHQAEVLYAGRIHPEKGLHLLVDAMRLVAERLPSVRLAVLGPWSHRAGGGGASYLSQLRAASEGLDVSFEDATADVRQLAKRIARASVFCYPSLAENGESFGIAALEAAATRTPLVVSSLRCFEDFLEPGVSGLVFNHRGPKPEEHLARALLRVLDSPSASQAMADRARLRSAEFSYRRLAGQHLDLYRRLVSACP